VEAVIDAPVIGYVPAVGTRELSRSEAQGNTRLPELVALYRPRSAIAEAFRSTRTALAFTGGNQSPGRFMVTSALPREGKTLVSINLAIALSRAGKKVLLVDADMRKPQVHKVFRFPFEPGLSNVLNGTDGRSPRDLIRPVPDVENLSCLPSGSLPPNPAELLGSARMRELVEELSSQFDVVVFDTPPVVNVTDAMVLCQHVLGAVLVVRAFSTQRDLVKRVAETFAQGNQRILGIVLNTIDVPRSEYYSYDSYYTYAHGSYYYYGDDNVTPPRKRRRRRSSVSGVS